MYIYDLQKYVLKHACMHDKGPFVKNQFVIGNLLLSILSGINSLRKFIFEKQNKKRNLIKFYLPGDGVINTFFVFLE